MKLKILTAFIFFHLLISLNCLCISNDAQIDSNKLNQNNNTETVNTENDSNLQKAANGNNSGNEGLFINIDIGDFILAIFQIVMGALIAITITIFIEYFRKPKLKLNIADPVDINYKDRPAKKVRFLGINVINKPLPKFTRWMQRNVALQCSGYITFYHLDGQNVFGKEMICRWSGTPEPVPMLMQINNRNIPIWNSARIISHVDIPPDEIEKIDVAARFDDESECYGWSNENYFSNPIWRHPDWKLKSERYIIKVTVITSSIKCEEVFRLTNDVSQQNFRIEKAQKSDYSKIS